MGNALKSIRDEKEIKEICQLRPEAMAASALEVNSIKRAFYRSFQRQTGLGFTLSEELLTSVFKDWNQKEANDIINLWRMHLEEWSDMVSEMEFVYLLIGCLCICKGEIKKKVNAMFVILGIIDQKALSKSQATLLVRVCVRAAANLTLCPVDISSVILSFKHYISQELKDRDSVGPNDFLEWACSPGIISFVLSHCGEDSYGSVSRIMRKREIISRQEALLQSKEKSRRLNTKERVERKYNRDKIRKLKILFDHLDVNRAGKVPFKLLSPHIQSTAAQRKAMHDQILTFEKFLSKVFPYCTLEERRILISWVYFKEVDQELIRKIRKMFIHLNVTFDGQIMLGRIIPLLQRSKYLEEYIGKIILHPTDVFTKVTFKQLLTYLFSRSHHQQLNDIYKYGSRGIPKIGPAQIAEATSAFQKVDSEKRGKISIEEFKSAIRRLGVASTTEGMQEDEMFAEYAEHTGSIGPLEYLRFYSKRYGQRNGQGH